MAKVTSFPCRLLVGQEVGEEEEEEGRRNQGSALATVGDRDMAPPLVSTPSLTLGFTTADTPGQQGPGTQRRLTCW